MKMISRISVLAIALVVTITGMAFAAELSMTKFTASPSPFKQGQSVSFDIEVQNTNATAVANPGEVYFYVTDGTPAHTGPGAFLGTTHLPSLPPGKTSVHLAQTYTVPAGTADEIRFLLYLPPITPGVEFGPSFEYKYHASCSYAPEMVIRPVGLRTLPVPAKPMKPKFPAK